MRVSRSCSLTAIRLAALQVVFDVQRIRSNPITRRYFAAAWQRDCKRTSG
jgi:hypothetical protein